MFRVLVADDQAIIRRGLRRLLLDTVEIGVADEACDGLEALDKARQGNYDAVLLDIYMPGLTGLEVLQRLRAEQPNLPVLIITAQPESTYETQAFEGGAAGFLHKEKAGDELVRAVHTIVQGGQYVSSPTE